MDNKYLLKHETTILTLYYTAYIKLYIFGAKKT